MDGEGYNYYNTVVCTNWTALIRFNTVQIGFLSKSHYVLTMGVAGMEGQIRAI